MTQALSKLDQNNTPPESSSLPPTAIASNDKSLEELKEQLSQLEARTKKGFLKVKTDIEEAKKEAPKQEPVETTNDSSELKTKQNSTD